MFMLDLLQLEDMAAFKECAINAVTSFYSILVLCLMNNKNSMTYIIILIARFLNAIIHSTLNYLSKLTIGWVCKIYLIYRPLIKRQLISRNQIDINSYKKE